MRLIIVILSCLLVVSCATQRNSQEVMTAKIYFEKGYYKRAFQTVLPAAANGDPEAQYTVGYMYYYGYGVAQDTNTGAFWIRKSAEQGYEPAIKAMRMIGRDQQTKQYQERQYKGTVR